MRTGVAGLNFLFFACRAADAQCCSAADVPPAIALIADSSTALVKNPDSRCDVTKLRAGVFFSNALFGSLLSMLCHGNFALGGDGVLDGATNMLHAAAPSAMQPELINA